MLRHLTALAEPEEAVVEAVVQDELPEADPQDAIALADPAEAPPPVVPEAAPPRRHMRFTFDDTSAEELT